MIACPVSSIPRYLAFILSKFIALAIAVISLLVASENDIFAFILPNMEFGISLGV